MEISDNVLNYMSSIANKVMRKIYRMNIKAENVKQFSLHGGNICSIYQKHILEKYIKCNIVFAILNFIVIEVWTQVFSFGEAVSLAIYLLTLSAYSKYKRMYFICCKKCGVKRCNITYFIGVISITIYTAFITMLNSSIYIIFEGDSRLYHGSVEYILLCTIIYCLISTVLIQITTLFLSINKDKIIKPSENGILLLYNNEIVFEYSINNFIIVKHSKLGEDYILNVYGGEMEHIGEYVLVDEECNGSSTISKVNNIRIGDSNINIENIHEYI